MLNKIFKKRKEVLLTFVMKECKIMKSHRTRGESEKIERKWLEGTSFPQTSIHDEEGMCGCWGCKSHGTN